jgi:tetratricopeptide (TPR) repeat protein
MAKKNKSRKARKQADQKLQKMKATQLIQKGEALLRADNFREAVQVLKLAHQKQPAQQQILTLLGRAYAGWENQLRRKGLVPEADAVHRQSAQYRPDASQISPADLIVFMESTGADNAVSLYNGFLATHQPDLEAETVLAGMFLAHAGCEATTQLSESALLKPALPLLQEAIQLMNDACWETALEHLRPVTRRSPLAGVKLLCRAMACFYQNDDPGMQRALAMIPDAFARHPLVEHLKSDPRQIAPLWQGRFITVDQTQFLLQTIKHGDFSGAGRVIKRLAPALGPQDSRSAIEQLLSMLWPLTKGGGIDSYDLAELAETLLPHRYGEAIAAKFYFLGFEDHLEDTDAYLELLDEEFPDHAEHAMAASMVLSESVAWIVGRGLQRALLSLLPDGATTRLGIRSRHPECILLEMILKALALDPQNSQAGDLLSRLPRTSRLAGQLAETGLLQLAENRPNDPQPCLALAELNFEKNAFRKAQTYLELAEQRAPHDEQVNDFLVLALLKSIDANLKREKHHLVKADLEKAAARCGNKTLAQVTARQILFEMAQTGQLSLFGDGVKAGDKGRIQAIIERHIADLPDVEALKTLGLLAADSRQRPGTWNKTNTSSLEAAFRSRASAVDRLSSKAIRKVVLPDVAGFPLPQGRSSWFNGFMTRYKNLMRRLGDEDVLPVLDLLLEDDRFGQCLKEIQRRLKTATEPFHALLLFYQMVVQCIDGRERADAEAFATLIARVQPQHLELFRTASRRLSQSASGPFKSALEHFNFELLDNWCDSPACSGGLGMDDWDDPDKDLVDDFDITDDLIQDMIDMVEMLIDEFHLRGASEKKLRSHRNQMMNDFKTKTMFKDLAQMITPAMAMELTSEAYFLIFG